MARPKNSPEKIQAMRNKMMDAVISLLDEVNPDKVSIRLIAEKVGVSHMVFYTYFENRDEIMQALIDREQKRIDQQFENLLEKAKEVPVFKVLEEVLDEYVASAHEHPKIFKLFWMTPKKSGRGRDQINSYEHLRPSIENIANLIQLGIKKGEISERDPHLAALAVMTIVNAHIILDQCGKLPDKFSCEQVMAENKRAFRAYLTD